MTDKERILQLFRNSHGILINVNTIIDGQFYGTKRIIEYTGRISDARKELGCTCGVSVQHCEATEHIQNVKTNWYRYVCNEAETNTIEAVEIDSEAVQKKYSQLQKQWKQLRDQYRHTPNKETLSQLKILEVQGKAVARSLELAERTQDIKEALT